MSTHIVNARVVNEGQVSETEVTIDGERIAAVGKPAPRGATIVDAQGAYLIPGMIDDQVHFREPGFEHKGDIGTESRAAIAGGITSYMEMPNCNPLTINQQELLNKRDRAAGKSWANYAFYLGATNDNLEDVKSVDHALTCGVKIFMGASTGNMLVDDETTLEGIFGSTSLLVATHCEDTPMILAAEAAAAERWGDNIPFREHPNIRSEEACYKSSSLAVGLAKKHGTKLHVLHLTTAREMELFDTGPIESKQITAEACVHHLFFSADDYEARGADIKCNPAIKLASDRERLLQAVVEDRIDVIATDHAPHTREEKDRHYAKAPAGLPLVQHALPSLFDRVADGTFDVTKLVHKTAHAPAILYQVAERGYIREGYYADLVLIDANQTNDEPAILSKCGWSPFAGHRFSHRVSHTWVNGHLRYRDGELLDGPMGLALTFDRS